jgi:hypothetical protein
MKSALLFAGGALIIFAAQKFLFLLLAHSLTQQASATEIANVIAGASVAALTLAVLATLSFLISSRSFHRNHPPLQAFAFGVVCALVGCFAGMLLTPVLKMISIPVWIALHLVVVCAVSAFIPVAFVARSRDNE